jgi:hypothetical protein
MPPRGEFPVDHAAGEGRVFGPGDVGVEIGIERVPAVDRDGGEVNQVRDEEQLDRRQIGFARTANVVGGKHTFEKVAQGKRVVVEAALAAAGAVGSGEDGLAGEAFPECIDSGYNAVSTTKKIRAARTRISIWIG